jgi:hypothetical protein
MARRAATHHGADWVVNNDDDEFWSGTTCRLREVLECVPETCDGLAVDRFNHPPVRDTEMREFFETMVYRERRSFNVFGSPLPPKVCHRAFADIIVSQGNHAASRTGDSLRICAAPDLTISHFPVRDFSSFERKIINGGGAYIRNTELSPGIGATWRWLYSVWEQGGLRAWYEEQLLTPDKIAALLSEQVLMRDHKVADALRLAVRA